MKKILLILPAFVFSLFAFVQGAEAGCSFAPSASYCLGDTVVIPGTSTCSDNWPDSCNVNIKKTTESYTQKISQQYTSSVTSVSFSGLSAGTYQFWAFKDGDQCGEGVPWNANPGNGHQDPNESYLETFTVASCTPPPTCSLLGSPTTITEGQSTTLSWSTTDATSRSIDNGVGSVGTSGSTSVSPVSTTTYTLSVSGAGGSTTCNRTITVNPLPTPTCSLSALPNPATQGQTQTLSWTTSDATSASINCIGSVSPVASGSTTIGNESTKLYTMTVTGAGGTNTCNINAQVVAAAFDTNPRLNTLWTGWIWSTRTSQLGIWFVDNVLKRTSLLVKPWDDAGYGSLTDAQQESAQIDWQFLRRRATDDYSVYVINANEKVVNSHSTREYFIPEKTTAEWTAVRAAIVGSQVPDLSIASFDSCDPNFFGVAETGDLDLMVGKYTGGLKAYENTGSASSPAWTAKTAWNMSGTGWYSAPAFTDLDGDDDYDMLVGQDGGISVAYENTGSASSPAWTAKTAWNTPDVGSKSTPTFGDLDGDGDEDLMIGANTGLVKAYENTGSASSPAWTAKTAWNTPDVGSNSFPFLVDLDGDGDEDLMIGEQAGVVKAYENTGSASSPAWTAKTAWNTPDVGTRVRPTFGDLDGDGDYDALVTNYSGPTYAYENTGSASSPAWTAKTAWNPGNIGAYSSPTLIDLDFDG